MNNLDDEHYIRKIIQASSTHTITAVEDIYNIDNVKVISKGLKIEPLFYERLIKHKLLKPIDQSLGVEAGVSSRVIQNAIVSLVQSDDLIKAIFNTVDNKDLILNIIDKVNIPNSIWFKLTLLQDELPATFEHDIKVALISIYIGLSLQLELDELLVLTCAGLCLDIGMLHMDSTFYEQGKILTGHQRKQIYAHPIISSMILSAYTATKASAKVVAQHHEHIDGSGYPYALQDDDISQLGIITGVAELVSSLSEATSDYSFVTRLNVIIKFNHHIYPQNISQHLLSLINNNEANTLSQKNLNIDTKTYLQKLSNIWIVLNAFDTAINQLQQSENSPETFLGKNISRLSHALQMSGLTLNTMTMSADDLNDFLIDSEELLVTLEECSYQIKYLSNELIRRWPKLADEGMMHPGIHAWLATMKSVLIEESI